MAVVIGESEVMPLLRAACPSFEERWRAHVSSNIYEEGLLYLDLAELARHLVELMQADTTTELPAVFEVIERLHLDGTDAVKEAATIGLLEDLQNLAPASRSRRRSLRGLPEARVQPVVGRGRRLLAGRDPVRRSGSQTQRLDLLTIPSKRFTETRFSSSTTLPGREPSRRPTIINGNRLLVGGVRIPGVSTHRKAAPGGVAQLVEQFASPHPRPA